MNMVGIKKILIAVDDEKSGKIIAKAGLLLAKQLKAKVALLSVVDTVALMTTGGISPYELIEHLEIEVKKDQQILLEKVFKEEPAKVFVEKGNPFDEIIKTAEEWKADLIVIGTHGRKGFPRLVLGSIAEKVIRHSTKPVFVVPINDK